MYPNLPSHDGTNRPSTQVLIGGGIALAVILVILFFTVAIRPDHTSAPTKLVPYNAPDGAFACTVPDGWAKRESASGDIQSSVALEDGDARIAVTSGMQGSLVGDMLQAASNQSENLNGDLPPGMQGNLPPQVPPVERLHAAGETEFEKRFPPYDEQPMQRITCSLGQACLSEWTGETDGWPSRVKLHGYRVTVLNNDREVMVVCRCSESDWPGLQPTFQKVITSLSAGTPPK
jgi:hypothetical protein